MTDAVEAIDVIEEQPTLPAPEVALECPKCKKICATLDDNFRRHVDTADGIVRYSL
jgi:hypothetical protein